jgi:hypothetical protein
VTKVVFPTDEHYPYQDEHARSVALQIVSDFNPDVRIAGSDGIDFYSISKFDKNPSRMKTLQKEIDAWTAGQKEWRDAAPEANAFFLVGNHEYRFTRYLYNHPELYDLEALQFPNLLGLVSLGIYWEKSKGDAANLELNLYNRLLIKHGNLVRKHSAYSARAEIENEFYSISTLTGHTHRGGSHYAQTRQGVVVAHECFCLCRLDPGYVQNPNWQQGIVLADVTAGSLSIEPIPFYQEHGLTKAIWRGKEYVE